MYTRKEPNQAAYHNAMGNLLILYTQVDRLIMEICAERIADAPDQRAKMALGKQVGDECRHVMIQQKWMEQFGTDRHPVFTHEQEEVIRQHFRELDWLDFLADMYICVEALGSEAVEHIVPLADPGTRESLRLPLSDELDHIAFGITRLREELALLSAEDRLAYIASLPHRIDQLATKFHELKPDIPDLFANVGADYTQLCAAIRERRHTLLAQVTSPVGLTKDATLLGKRPAEHRPEMFT